MEQNCVLRTTIRRTIYTNPGESERRELCFRMMARWSRGFKSRNCVSSYREVEERCCCKIVVVVVAEIIIVVDQSAFSRKLDTSYK